MTSAICGILLLLLLPWVATPAAASIGSESMTRLDVLSLSPKPNYHLTSDPNDPSQLADGHLTCYPIWLHRDSVGWHNRTPVLIRARLEHGGDAAHGVLRFLTAKGTYAGVWPPIRIDVFRARKGAAFRLAGSYQGERDALGDKRTHWIDVPVAGHGAELKIVVHAQGTNIFLDEIKWRAQTADASSLGEEQEYSSDKGIVRFSTGLLKQAYLNRTVPGTDVQATWSGMPSQLYVWSADPWTRLPAFPELGQISTKAQLNLEGFNGEREVGCLGLFRPREAGSYRVEVDPPNEAVTLKSVESILAANGELVYDPLVKLDNGVINVKAGRTVYLWVEVNLTALKPGLHRIQLNIIDKSSSSVSTVPLNVKVVGTDLASYKPAAVNWAYTSSRPIWNQPDKTLADLVSHGIDVFVVPPQHIPLPSLDGKWDIDRALKLARDLDLFRPHARQILLALGWHPRKKPSWLGPGSYVPEEKQREAVATWARKLKTFMDNSGVPRERWMLYPVDEPHSEKKEALKTYLQMLNSAVPDFRYYTNPVAARKDRLTISEIKELLPVIDQWGPSLSYAEGNEGRYLKESKRSFWVYHNPAYPAKTSSPLVYYRWPAWRAWLVGASGVGVWSYGDTQKSSAWDDFDGLRGDWAMVYESEEGPVSSRRWEAFREGIEDLQLLRGLEQNGCISQGLRIRVQHAVAQELASSVVVDKLRAALLSGECPSLSH